MIALLQQGQVDRRKGTEKSRPPDPGPALCSLVGHYQCGLFLFEIEIVAFVALPVGTNAGISLGTVACRYFFAFEGPVNFFGQHQSTLFVGMDTVGKQMAFANKRGVEIYGVQVVFLGYPANVGDYLVADDGVVDAPVVVKSRHRIAQPDLRFRV